MKLKAVECYLLPFLLKGEKITKDREICFEIVKHLGVLSQDKNGWKKETNVIVWNQTSAKIDIRSWCLDYSKMSKGITLSLEEYARLRDIVKMYDI